MRVVHKYEVEFGAEAKARMPLAHTQILHVGVRAGSVWVWALVDPLQEAVVRSIGYFNTGDSIPDGWRHVGTFASSNEKHLPPGCCGEGHYVGHVFCA